MNNDTHLIWEQFERRAAVQRQKRRFVTESVIQEQITSRLIEEILIEEGLMDTIKGAGQKVAGAVKNIGQAVNDRVLQPILKKAVDWLAQNDPDTLVSVMGAAEEGPEALDQLVGAEGGDQVEQQIANAPQAVNESVDLYKEILREHILYLHNEGLLSKIGQGIGNIGRKAKQGIDYVNQNAPEWKKQAQQGLQNVKQNVQQGVADLRQGVQQGYSGEQPAAPDAEQPAQQPGALDPNNPTDSEMQQYDADGDGELSSASQADAPGGQEKYRMGHDRIFGGEEPAPEQPAAGGDQKQGLISKIVGWVKENPNMSKGIAMGIFGAANLALGAGLAAALAPMAGGYAIGGGIAGVMEYRKLRQQGMEPKEALAQAAKTANEKGLTAGMFAGGASLIGNIAGKIMGGGDAAAPQQQAQPGQSQPVQQPVAQGPSGQVQNVGVPNAPAGTGEVGGMGPVSSQDWLKAARQGKRVMPDELDYFQEGILKRPGWFNKTIR